MRSISTPSSTTSDVYEYIVGMEWSYSSLHQTLVCSLAEHAKGVVDFELLQWASMTKVKTVVSAQGNSNTSKIGLMHKPPMCDVL